MESEIAEVTDPDDLECVAALATAVWHEHYGTLLTPLQIDYMLEKYQSVPAMTRQVEKEKYRYFLLRGENKVPIGYFGIQPGPESLFLSKYYILHRYRGQGYASAGFRYMEALARQSGFCSIWLTVNKNNSGSIAVYKHRGFQITKEQVTDIGNGFVMDDYIMEKKLNL